MGYQLIDNNLATSLVPERVVKKFDQGILRKELHKINLQEGAPTYGYNYQSKATFRWNKQNAEDLNRIKIGGNIELAGSATKGTMDGNILGEYSQATFQETNSTIMEQVGRANILALSHKLCTAHQQNLESEFNDWSDNLYKQDSATNGVAERILSSGNIPSLNGNSASNVVVTVTNTDPNKLQLTNTAQPFEFYLRRGY